MLYFVVSKDDNANPKRTDGLPMMLVEGGGANSGLRLAQVTAAALISENKTLGKVYWSFVRLIIRGNTVHYTR